MEDKSMDRKVEILSKIVHQVLERLFTPAPLIRPSSFIRNEGQMRDAFEQASELYLRGVFVGAWQAFNSLANELSGSAYALRRIVLANAAASALLAGENDYVIEVMQPIHASGQLYGIPLWNLALAYYRLDSVGESLAVVRSWIARDLERNKARLGRGEMICACLSLLLDDRTAAHEHLSRGYHLNPNLVDSQLVDIVWAPALDKRNREPINEKGQTKDIQQDLLRLVEPKRPFRSPALSNYLTYEEIELYSLGLEVMAEGDIDAAQDVFLQLREKHPRVAILNSAVAACYLFNDQNQRTVETLEASVQAGHDLSGLALWNLACAKIRMRDLDGARAALVNCAKTEYKTSSRLWNALELLQADASVSRTTVTKVISTRPVPIKPSQSLVDGLPETLLEIRIEILTRLIRPRRLQKGFKPDLGRLSQREQQNVMLVLTSANKVSVAQAAEMLMPLTSLYPQLYTVKAHAAAYHILGGDLETGRRLLTEAETIQPLDLNSCYNLAYVYLQAEDYDRVASVLQRSEETALATQYHYWLALAIALELGGQSGAAAAGRAIALARKSPGGATVDIALRKANIDPDSAVSLHEPHLDAAQNALHHLANEDVSAALKSLFGDTVPSVEAIPEFGRQIFEPLIFLKPSTKMNDQIAKTFREALVDYNVGSFQDAAAKFRSVYESSPIAGVALNMAATFLKLGQPAAARKIARRALQRRPGLEWQWRLAYNHALADNAMKENERAIQTIERYLGLINNRAYRKSLNSLMVALCTSSTQPGDHAHTVSEALTELQSYVPEPSDPFLLAFIWSQLKLSVPNIDRARDLLKRLLARSQRLLLPAAEVNSMNRVRSAFDTLMQSRTTQDAIDYMVTVIEARARQRQQRDELSDRELEQNIGVEHVARVSLVKALYQTNERERMFRELYEAENFVRDHRFLLPSGFLARDWLSLAQVADETSVPEAAIRYCNSGLEVEPGNMDLEILLNRLQSAKSVEGASRITEILDSVRESLEQETSLHFVHNLDELRRHAPIVTGVLQQLLTGQQMEEVDNVCERITILAHVELPESSYPAAEALVSCIAQMMGEEDYRIPIEIDTYDERIWPRLDDEKEGSCLLTIVSSEDIEMLTVSEMLTERKIWEGSLSANATQYIRWTFFQEDGFPEDSYLDIPLLLVVRNGSSFVSLQQSISLIAGSSEPVWPVYPTGALSPDDVPGAELYGRTPLIRQIQRSLGRDRSQATYFLQGPRQMGKTSLLYFLKERVPDHVLAVYVNLEKRWSRSEPDNVWSYLVQRVQEEAFSISRSVNASCNERDLATVVKEACVHTGKSYCLLLIDELHQLFDKSKFPEYSLAEFREYLNNRDMRIALLLSDRYTRDELQSRCESEYWAQLSLLTVGPLDYESTKLAVDYPTRGSDFSFLEPAVKRLYQLTGGYPYHVQRVAQMVLEKNYAGPWLTALPEDVDDVVLDLVRQDILFQSGLCRPDRVSDEIAYAVAALLEWKDLRTLLPQLIEEDDDERKIILAAWQPQLDSFLAHFPQPDRVADRLVEIGLMRGDGKDFFSPLLEMWLRRMRSERRTISHNQTVNHWEMLSTNDGIALSDRAWQNLDSDLIQRSKHRGKPPLKEKATRADQWEAMVREVNSESDFNVFLDALYRLFVDGREEKNSLPNYPWLFLVYHRIRLVRNYIVHQSETATALAAWNDVTSRAFGGSRSAYRPVITEEWRKLQFTLLRNLFAALTNAIEIAGGP